MNTAQDWRRIFELLDVALELPDAERATWLDGLRTGGEQLCAQLTELLRSRAQMETRDFLGAPARVHADAVPTGEAVARAAGDIVGPYRLIREIGVGGMGAVWLAERTDGLIKRPIALKLPRAGWFGPAFADRLARERDILGALDHPNIARLIDTGLAADGQPYLALQYVDGSRIDAYCDSHELGVQARLQLFLQVAHAVAHAHTHLVIHRDLKPSNVLVTESGQVCLLDFGIAKILASDGATSDSDLTQYAGRVLTPDYAAPEQVTGEPLTTAADVYALGVLLYELLSGISPYADQRGSRAELEKAIINSEPPAPSGVVSDAAAKTRGDSARGLRRRLAGDLDTIVLKALKKTPAERYASVSAFADDVERYLSGEAVLARPESRWYRARKFVRRNRLGVAAAAAVFIALGVGLGVASWEARIARAQAARAEDIKDFIQSVFTSASPSKTGAASMRVVDLLLQARARIETEFANRPDMQVELLCTVASSIADLTELSEAQATFERASVLAEKSGGLARVPLSCRIGYANLLLSTDDYKRVPQLIASIESELRSQKPSIELARIVLTKAVYYDIGENDNAKAVAAAKEGVELTRKIAGAASRDHIDALLQLGRLYYWGDKYTEGMAPVDEALKLLPEMKYGEQQGDTIVFNVLRANLLGRLGSLEEAARLYQVQLPNVSKVFGRESIENGIALNEYSKIERARGDLRHALALASDAIAMCRAAGMMKTDVANVSETLALAQAEARKADAVIKTEGEAAETFPTAYGADGWRTIRARALLARADAWLGRTGESLTRLQALATQMRSLHPDRLSAPLLFLGEAGILARHSDEAVLVLRDAISQSAKWNIAEQANVPELHGLLGLGLVDLGQFDEAESELKQALAAMDKTQVMMTPVRASLHVGLARLALARNESEAALGHARIADEFWQDFDPATRWAGEAAYWRARALRATGKSAEAREASERARRILSNSRLAQELQEMTPVVPTSGSSTK